MFTSHNKVRATRLCYSVSIIVFIVIFTSGVGIVTNYPSGYVELSLYVSAVIAFISALVLVIVDSRLKWLYPILVVAFAYLFSEAVIYSNRVYLYLHHNHGVNDMCQAIDWRFFRVLTFITFLGSASGVGIRLITKKHTKETIMKTRPYLTFNGQCKEAIELYKRAFNTDTLEYTLFDQMPEIPGFTLPEEYKSRVMQATMAFGDDFIRLSDCGYAPGFTLNEQESERISMSIEASVDEIKHAFAILSEEGRVGMGLTETFYSPCAAVVFDKFGVMWNLSAVK